MECPNPKSKKRKFKGIYGQNTINTPTIDERPTMGRLQREQTLSMKKTFSAGVLLVQVSYCQKPF